MDRSPGTSATPSRNQTLLHALTGSPTTAALSAADVPRDASLETLLATHEDPSADPNKLHKFASRQAAAEPNRAESGLSRDRRVQFLPARPPNPPDPLLTYLPRAMGRKPANT